MNSLLFELELDHHNELLEKGNLRKSRVVHAPFGPWISGGYLARVIRSTCTRCGTQTDSLAGIYHLETRGSERRETLSRVIPSGDYLHREYAQAQTQACLDCIPQG